MQLASKCGLGPVERECVPVDCQALQSPEIMPDRAATAVARKEESHGCRDPSVKTTGTSRAPVSLRGQRVDAPAMFRVPSAA